MYVCMHVRICMYGCMYVCLFVFVYVYIDACILLVRNVNNSCVHTYMHRQNTFTYTCKHADVQILMLLYKIYTYAGYHTYV